VQPSSDGVPFVLHDSTVDRTTDGTGAIRGLTSTHLKTLDAGSWFSPQYAGEKMPTLAEQLADLRTRGGDLLLEIKGSHTKAQVATVVNVIRAQQMTSRVFVQSFDTGSLKYVRELAPELPLGLLRGTLDAGPAAVAADLGLTAYNPLEAAGVDGIITNKPAELVAWNQNRPGPGGHSLGPIEDENVRCDGHGPPSGPFED